MTENAMIGPLVPGWAPPPRPGSAVLEGAYVRLERLAPDAHAADLFRAFSGNDALWTYLNNGPFATAAAYHRYLADTATGEDPFFYAIRPHASGRCGGVAAYLRIAPESGTIEVGHITFAPELNRSRASSEAMFLMMDWAFANGYRRYEWKCNALNLPSRRAAQRLGFSYEGTFRQHMISRGRNRDTAWFSVIDREWPRLREAFLTWLSPANFEPDGQQRERLSDLTAPIRETRDPGL